MKKAAVAAAGFLLTAVLLTGCQQEKVKELIEPLIADVQTEEESETAQETEEEELSYEIDTSIPIQTGARVAVVSKSTDGEFWNLIRKGMEDAVNAVNTAYGFEKDQQITMTFEGPGNELDVETQINILDAVIAENPDVVCLSASDMDSCQAQLEAARENGIPVVMFDSNVSETDLIRAYRGSRNTYIGEMAAYRLSTAIGKMGKVAVFSAQEKTQSAKDRVDGFLDMISNYTDIEVVEVIYQDQVEDMEAAMQEVLEKNPVLDGVFCTNADVAEMYLNMDNKGSSEGNIAMVGVDATARQQEAIKDGEEIGVVSQDPYAMGYETMWTALKATAPRKLAQIQKAVLLDPIWIDETNIDSPEVSNYLYTQ